MRAGGRQGRYCWKQLHATGFWIRVVQPSTLTCRACSTAQPCDGLMGVVHIPCSSMGQVQWGKAWGAVSAMRTLPPHCAAPCEHSVHVLSASVSCSNVLRVHMGFSGLGFKV